MQGFSTIRCLASARVRVAILLVLLSVTTMIAPAQAQSDFTISTDRTTYYYGDTVTVYIQPAPAMGVSYWLMITKPDGSQMRLDLSTGQGTATLVAGYPPGQWGVELWGQVVGPDSSPQFYAGDSFEVREQAPAQFTISTDQGAYDYGDMITIYIQPAPAIGVDYWLIINKPDGSQDRLDLSPGTADATTSAGPPPGQYEVSLWGQLPSSGPSQVYAQCSYEVRAPAPPQFTISTDQPAYDYGDAVRIYIQPAPAIGVSYWLIITKPDGSQDRQDLGAGQGSANAFAGPPPGQWRVELWGQAVAPNMNPQVYATCYFEVRQPTPPQQFTISTDQSIYNYGDTVTIYIQPAPAIGVSYWLMITKPDGSQKKANLNAGQGTANLVAGAPPGQWRVELWGQVVGPNQNPQFYASDTFEVRAPTPTEFTISTDRTTYYIGDTVTIYIQPAPAIGVSYWLVITRPDGSQTRIDLSSGQGTAGFIAGPPPGQDTVELWGQVVGSNQSPQVYASDTFEVRQQAPTQFTISTDRTTYYYGDTVTIYIQPAPAIGVSYWLMITKPDGSQTRLDLSSGQGTATLVAGYPSGQWRVELWGQVVGPDTNPQLYASHTFQVREQVTYTTTAKTTVTTSGLCLLRQGEKCILGCVIATAAYGSEMAPEVVFMRQVRDNMIGSTPIGETLVASFNAFYYSWSPALAQAIAGNGLLRAVFRVLLLPLLGIIHATALVFTAMTNATGSSDIASVVGFLAAAIMTMTVYVALPLLVCVKLAQVIRRRRV